MNIPQEKTTEIYELTCLLEPEYTQEELKKRTQEIQAVLEKNKAKEIEVEQWGKKDLAYLIKNAGKSYREANFAHFVFKADPAVSMTIKNEMNILDFVIRYLLIKQEN